MLKKHNLELIDIKENSINTFWPYEIMFFYLLFLALKQNSHFKSLCICKDFELA